MEVYRIVKEKYANSLSGIGAAIVGGRWNSKGTEILYTSQSRALSVLEVLVHLPKNLIPSDLVFLKIYIPNSTYIETIELSSLPDNWFQFPPLRITQQIGDDFVRKNKALLLQVPSAIVKEEYNLLINTYHKDFGAVKVMSIEKFDLDNRLF